MNGSEERIAGALQSDIESELDRAGILFRVFSRAKSVKSIERKFKYKDYHSTGKKMQDLFGIRVVLYFPADSEIAQEALKRKYRWLEADSTIDVPSMATFGPTRCNLIFRLPESLSGISEIIRTNKKVDSTFEVQFRTVSSEGWHEIEHDLRYKNRSSWDDHMDLDRSMNGIIATLEMCDWSVESLLDKLAYRNYKDKDWDAMIRNKFRLRFQEGLSLELRSLFDENIGIAKRMYRIDRVTLLKCILQSDAEFPITASNIVYCANQIILKIDEISGLTPEPLWEEFEDVSRYYQTMS